MKSKWKQMFDRSPGSSRHVSGLITKIRRHFHKGFLLVIALGSQIAAAAIPESERQALMDLYNATGGPSWTRQTNWMGPAGTECTWLGVRCDENAEHVITIRLSNRNMVGQLPSLSAFTEMYDFEAPINHLTGSMPSLPPGLESLMLAVNAFSGPLPDVSALAKFVDLRGNEFTGPLPTREQTREMRGLWLSNNQLSGEIPELAGLSNLQAYCVGNNHLSGSIPDLSGLVSLVQFDVSNSGITGGIPSLSDMVSLQDLMVENNNLSGSVPDFSNNRDLRVFAAYNSGLSGSLPSLSGLSRLQTFIVGRNNITGEIPSLSGLTQLWRLDLAFNHFSGTLPSLSDLSNLEYLTVGGNELSGSLPEAPASVDAGNAMLCPNAFVHDDDPAWDTATGTAPWYRRCETVFADGFDPGAVGI